MVMVYSSQDQVSKWRLDGLTRIHWGHQWCWHLSCLVVQSACKFIRTQSPPHCPSSCDDTRSPEPVKQRSLWPSASGGWPWVCIAIVITCGTLPSDWKKIWYITWIYLISIIQTLKYITQNFLVPIICTLKCFCVKK